ncbi:Uncharacterised protein [Proteus vulgaris]|uniref:Uncharacterized protein n=1 Tax=Proteus vulgaris TaxID=585 RepID=A0A379FDZ5_PROVU|nr:MULTISPECIES: hypothetical protein [Proteus]NBL76281.1 hypothetical protein [Proteus sp. G2672]NBL77505.1 hypothetical protein [Proteus sp. G2672]NBL78260.1 hypothetical protein [Proteus sp. G2672]QPN89218.1 hypothetical protein IM703_15725 [Proteus vulgaris]SUC17553.1 Uncharacterised protein [Proteus vulgaris]
MQGINSTKSIQLEVLYMGKDCICVIFLKGPAPVSALQDIETQLLQDAEEYEMFTEHGTYQISVTRDNGEYDSCGRCEIAPYWDFDIQSFEPMPEEYYAGN